MGSEACHEKPHAVMIPYPAQGHVTPMMKMAKLLHARGFHAQLTDKAHLDTVVQGVRGMCDNMRLRDFPSFMRTTDRGDIMLNFFVHEGGRLSLPTAVMINTFDELERPVLDAMRAILPPLYTVGPLLLHDPHAVPGGTSLDALGSNLWKEQDGLLDWLDGHGANSVVYVNYGSITVMTNEQLLEFAWGLANSGYPFIWNIRPDLVKGDTAVLPPEFMASIDGRAMLTTWCSQEKVLAHKAVGVFLTHSGWNSTLESISNGVPMLSWALGVRGDTAVLPAECLASIAGRAMLTTWCSQEKVLAHKAVGVFLTHSGWNSTLESISNGVPMLSWPFFAEQQTNCRYKCTEWGNGMEIDGEVKREVLAAMIREAMEGEKGLEMRRRAAEWKASAVRATLPGGSAVANLDSVIRDVLLAKFNNKN
uniref:Glycosyltransferase n=1 Tax=Aegilops tauschii TaxID=37682 RepID=M8BPL4_AEGTA